MRAITFSDRLRYRFDNLMSRGTAALIGALFLMSALLIGIVSFLVLLGSAEGQEIGFGKLLWMGLMRMLDAGTMGGDEGGPLFLAGMFIVTMGYSDKLDAQQADARTLVTLLHLRDIANRAGQPFSIVSEMLDSRNRDLAEVTRADDFIVSDKLISLLMSQIAENRELKAVFDDLFDPDGSELYLKDAGDYVALGKPVNFYTVIEAARCRGEVAIGYRRRAEAQDAAKSYGVHVNPAKSQPIMFAEGDRVIVLAEE